jgi:uncharacterized protein
MVSGFCCHLFFTSSWKDPGCTRPVGPNFPNREEDSDPMALPNPQIDRNRLTELCRRYGVARLEVIGSFARGDAGPESDLDILVTFEPNAQIGLEFIALKEELEALVGRPVDLLTRTSVEGSPNKYFRRYALRRTEPLYEQA